MPRQWVLRTETPDYGIDGSVEVFAADGQATGLRFLVQLKATETKVSRPTVRIRRTTADYYHALAVPVMLVLWSAAEDRLLWRWFHTFDPYYGGLTDKWVTIHLDDTHEWHEATATEIVDDLQAYRTAASPTLQYPAAFQLLVAEDGVGGRSATAIRLEIKSRAQSLRHVIHVSDDSGSLGRIRVGRTEAECRFGSRYTATLHYPTDESPDRFAPEVLMLISMALSKAGQHSAAISVAREAASDSELIAQPEALGCLLRSMSKTGQISTALQLSDQLEARGDLIGLAEAVVPAVFLGRGGLTAPDRAMVSQFYVRKAALYEASGEHASAGTAIYNGARIGAASALAQLRGYRRAAKLNTDYCRRDYFWRELGILFFNSRRYTIAAKCYRLAVKEFERPDWEPFYADALMHAGRYDEAKKEFDAYLSGAADAASAEWYLKRMALETLISATGVSFQVRRPRGAAQRLSMDPSDERAIREALELDLLCSDAWFNRGVTEAREGDREEAGVAFLLAALFNTTVTEAWANALSLALDTGDESLAHLIATAAYHSVGEELVVQLTDIVVAQSEEYPKEDMLRTIETLGEYLRALPQRTEAVELRFGRMEGGYEKIEWNGDERD